MKTNQFWVFRYFKHQFWAFFLSEPDCQPYFSFLHPLDISIWVALQLCNKLTETCLMAPNRKAPCSSVNCQSPKRYKMPRNLLKTIHKTKTERLLLDTQWKMWQWCQPRGQCIVWWRNWRQIYKKIPLRPQQIRFLIKYVYSLKKYLLLDFNLNFQATKASDAFPCYVSPRRDAEVIVNTFDTKLMSNQMYT